jgi:hypothetical protein
MYHQISGHEDDEQYHNDSDDCNDHNEETTPLLVHTYTFSSYTTAGQRWHTGISFFWKFFDLNNPNKWWIPIQQLPSLIHYSNP